MHPPHGNSALKSNMYKSQHFSINDHVNNLSNRICKGTCTRFKAKKPLTGGRYEAGQYRCQTCAIYLTEHGVDENYCKCCNMKVRSKPRNSLYKEKYHSKINAKDPRISATDNRVGSSNYANNDCEIAYKTAPVYDTIDESSKTYYEFKEFLDLIKLRTNYPLVILKELLEYGKLHKGEIAESLAYFNNKDTRSTESAKFFFNIPDYGILLNRGFITENSGPLPVPYYTLNVVLEDFQKIELISYFTNAITRYNQERGIPENEFPEANNMGNIHWTYSDLQDCLDSQKARNSTSSNSFWIWSVTPENWEIVKSKNVWGSIATKERVGSKVKAGDQVAFYVTGSNSFKGVFEFVGEWYDSTSKTWDGDSDHNRSLKYRSHIKLATVQLGSVNVSDLYDKMELFIGKSQHIRNLILRGNNGYPSNNRQPLTCDDFEILRDSLANSHETAVCGLEADHVTSYEKRNDKKDNKPSSDFSANTEANP